MARSRLNRRQTLLGVIATSVMPVPAGAAATRYVLDPEHSSVRFQYILNGQAQTGQMPVRKADINVDPHQLTRSSVDVTLDVARARTGFILATQAMLGPDVLDAAQHPTIRFVSRRIHLGAAGRISSGARIDGDVTLRGITRPLTLNASLYRLPGSAPDDLRRLDVHLDGYLSRGEFGAIGFPDLVADTVSLDIRVRIRAVE